MAVGNQINIGNLGFEDIRSSIITFLKTQDTGAASYLNDYDYDGSALSTLIDLLAYNTLYYGYYSNMIANEMFLDSAQREESLISLTKPLGYAVPGYNSAVGKISLTKGGRFNEIPKYDKFTGTKSDGSVYIFRTIETYELNEEGKNPAIKLYEAKSYISSEFTSLINYESQSILLSDYPDIDISSLTVEVSVTGKEEDFVEYILSSNITTNVDENQELYWLERNTEGFKIIFGGLEEELTNRTVGKRIVRGDLVRLSFITSNGVDGNGVFAFSYDGDALSGNNEVTTINVSSGGSDGPDIDSIRFYAPRWFASQDRAVTKDDCIGMLQERGFENFSLWGGDEAMPPEYGKVFMSFEDDDLCNVAKETLDEKLVVTIYSECVPSANFVLLCNIVGEFNPNKTHRSEEDLSDIIKSTIFGLYQDDNFGVEFNRDVFVDEVRKKDDAITIDSISLFIRNEQAPSNGKRKIKFLNEINKGDGSGGGIASSKITSSSISTDPFWLEDNPNTGNVVAWRTVNGLKNIISDDAGTVDYDNGVVKINEGVVLNDFSLIAELPHTQYNFIAKENMLLEIFPNVILVPRG